MLAYISFEVCFCSVCHWNKYLLLHVSTPKILQKRYTRNLSSSFILLPKIGGSFENTLYNPHTDRHNSPHRPNKIWPFFPEVSIIIQYIKYNIIIFNTSAALVHQAESKHSFTFLIISIKEEGNRCGNENTNSSNAISWNRYWTCLPITGPGNLKNIKFFS